MYYAVRIGKKPGIYDNWNDCKANVIGFKGAVYKKFNNKNDALDYINGSNTTNTKLETLENSSTNLDNKDYSFVDGSFNKKTGVYGYGGFLVANNVEHILQGANDDPDHAKMWNIAGELDGSLAAVNKAIELGLDEISIIFDYQGIESWATGEWKRKHKTSIEYYQFFQEINTKIKVNFIKVKGHSGVEGNERADKLAREAVGL